MLPVAATGCGDPADLALTGGLIENKRHKSTMISIMLECSGSHTEFVSTRPRVVPGSGCRRYAPDERLRDMVTVGVT